MSKETEKTETETGIAKKEQLIDLSGLIENAENINEVFDTAMSLVDKNKVIWNGGAPYRYRTHGKVGVLYPGHKEPNDPTAVKMMDIFIVGFQKTCKDDFFNREFYGNTEWYEILFIDDKNRFASMAITSVAIDLFSTYLAEIESEQAADETLKATGVPIATTEAFVISRFLFFMNKLTRVTMTEKQSAKYGKYYAASFALSETQSEEKMNSIFQFLKEFKNLIPFCFTLKPLDA